MTVNALIDSGANHSAISSRLARALGLDGTPAPYRVVTFGGEAYHQPSKLVQITLRTLNGVQSRTLVVRSIDDLCGNLRVQRWNQLKYQWPHTRDIDFPEPVGDLGVDLLIGTENTDFVRVTRPDVVGPRPQDPVIRHTVLGPMPMGLTRIWEQAVEDRVNLSQAFACHANQPTATDRERLERESRLYTDLRRVFSVEHRIEEDFLRNVKDHKTVSYEQARASGQVLASRIFLQHEERYRACIPWRSEARPRPNLWRALGIFKSYVRRQGPDSEAICQMMTTIKDWIDAGYARVLDPHEARRPGGFVIPSFIVTREDKTSTQHRLVINAAKEFDGICLNDYIARTPDVMNELYGVLLRFRIHRVAYTADIQKMFLQIETEPADRQYLRILYQPLRPGPVYVVECGRHMFGLASSPYVAIEIIKTHAREHADRWPEAAKAILGASIVDDVLVSVPDEATLWDVHHQLQEMFGSMSMHIHKCASNNARFMQSLPPEQRAKQVRLEDISSSNPELMPVVKTLGMVYDPTGDEFRFEYQHEVPARWTLRHMVSAVARVYDPLGLVTPFMMAGRAVVQLIWLEHKKWDDPLSASIAAKCTRWVERARELLEVRIPRRITALHHDGLDGSRLVAFCDACRIGYAAVVYAVGPHAVQLVAARCRVAPAKKDESVQRLELAGCQLAVSVAAEVCDALGAKISEMTFYTDSVTALAWLRTTSKMSVYVSNRVCKVRDRTDIRQWRHVPGDQNPADLASRGCRPRRLVSGSRWFQGPEFLLTGEEPPQPTLVEDDAVREELISFDNHIRKVTFFRYLVDPVAVTPFMIAFVESKELLGRAVRILAAVLEAVRRLRRHQPLPLGSRTLYKEVWDAVMAQRVKLHQAEHWPRGLEQLQRGKPAPELKQVRPYLDPDGVMRVNSRLNDCWWLSHEVRNPVLLRSKGTLPRQILRHYHVEQLRHAGGPGQLLAAARQHFWITNPRQLVRQVVADCRVCQISKRRTYRPSMANLHPSRLGFGRRLKAFGQIGVDMAGPFTTKGPPVTRGRRLDHKRYMLILTCSVTRAVCIEMMWTADTTSCLSALERFVATYGCPETITSDCGSNLLGARAEMKARWDWWRSVTRAAASRFPEVRWNVNPPYSPNWGGHYERLIGVAKETLGRMLMQHAGLLGDEELMTFFKRVQELLNNRPLTVVVQDDDAMEALTPNSFLKTGGEAPLLPFGAPSSNLTLRMRLLEDLLRQFWKQFLTDYVPTLHKTEKWHRQEPPLTVGDVVAVLYQGAPAGHWPLGRIVAAYPGRDGQTRSVEVETIRAGEKRRVRRSVSGTLPCFPIPNELSAARFRDLRNRRKLPCKRRFSGSFERQINRLF